MGRELILEFLFSYRIRQSADVQLSAHTSSCLRNDDVLRMRERAEMTAGTGNTCRSELASVQIPSRKATSGPGAFVFVAIPAPQRWHLTSTIPRISKASHPCHAGPALSFFPQNALTAARVACSKAAQAPAPARASPIYHGPATRPPDTAATQAPDTV